MLIIEKVAHTLYFHKRTGPYSLISQCLWKIKSFGYLAFLYKKDVEIHENHATYVFHKTN